MLVAACGLLDVPAYEVDLVGAPWVVRTIDGQAIEEQPPPTVTFQPADRLAVWTGCRDGTGAFTYDTDGSAILIARLALLGEPCEGTAGDLENRLLSALYGVEEWDVVRDGIRLIGPVELRLEREP